jgi:superfamily II DNA helicase RecQ
MTRRLHACMQTATATPQVRSAIIEELALQSPMVLAAAFNRPNIRCDFTDTGLAADAPNLICSVQHPSGLPAD